MRQAFNGKIWKDEAGDLIAFNLGADYCAEHEWGIGGIISNFKIDSSELGIGGRTVKTRRDEIKKVEAHVKEWSLKVKGKSAKKKKLYGVGFTERFMFTSDQTQFDLLIEQTRWDREKDEIKAFWSDSKFFLMVEEEKLVDQLIAAFERKDIAFWIGGGGPFQNGGLCIAIVSKLTDDFKQTLLDDDVDLLNLKKVAQATGIYETLKQHKKDYYSLSPRWKDDTKSEIRFWLNPREQSKYNFGWYSVDELRQWTEEKGPIVKQ